jgi:putative ABC transport system permease protein
METLLKDIRYGFRLLIKKPSFTFIVVVTLALGIGINTAIFTVVDAALIRPLHYKEPDRLVHIWETNRQQEFNEREASYPDYLDYKNHTQTLEDVAGYAMGSFTLTGRDAPERIQGAQVTANFFSVLGVSPIEGRAFSPGEDNSAADRVAMLSYRLWQSRFAGDAGLVGQTITLNGNPFTVVGILPRDFSYAPVGEAEIWTALRPSRTQLERRYQHWLRTIARLKPGVTLDEARADMETVAARIAGEHPESHTGTQVRLVPLHEQMVGNIKPVLLALLAAVGFVLLIACANIANLMMVRSASRQKEFAIRQALGAGRSRLIRQLATESVLLSIAGGAVGLLWSQWVVDLLIAAIPQQQLNSMPYLKGLSLNWQVLSFTCAITVLTGFAFGLAPALQTSKLDLNQALKEGGRTGGESHNKARSALVVSEVALAMVLLVGAGLMMKSLLRLLEVDPGFKTGNLLTMRVSLPPATYSDQMKVDAFYKQLLTRTEALPGVKGAATVSVLPLIGGDSGGFLKEGEQITTAQERREANLRTVSENYFSVMGIPLISGRYFEEQDDTDAALAVIINQTLAARFFSSEDAVGRQITFTFGEPVPYRIVGVVADEKVVSLDARTTPVIYFSALQEMNNSMALVVRTDIDPASVIGAIRSEVQSLDRDVPVYGVRTMEQLISTLPSTFLRRYPAILIAVFAAVALALAAIGIYGVISYSVSQRTHEIGIRVALGASRRDVLKLVIGRGLVLAIIGVAVGFVASVALTRLLSSMLFNVAATDAATFAMVSLLLIGVALLACAVPARRATKVDPMVALRYE